MCLIAVRQDGWILSRVREPTPEICLAAVRQNGAVLDIVKERTPEICLESVRWYGRMLRFVEEQTPEICAAAIAGKEKSSKHAKIPLEMSLKNFLSFSQVPTPFC
jgi:predicted RNase H-like nuclease